jgi:hypothetical protein
MRNQRMKVRLLLSLLVCGLCGCAANTPYSETVIDTQKGTRERGLPEVQVYDRPVYSPGATSDSITGGHF